VEAVGRWVVGVLAGAVAGVEDDTGEAGEQAGAEE
jgi:hypothetical protein